MSTSGSQTQSESNCNTTTILPILVETQTTACLFTISSSQKEKDELHWNALPDNLKKCDKLLSTQHPKNWLQDQPF